MRDNYAIAAVNARSLFLQWNQEEMIRRCGLMADDEAIHIRYLNCGYSIDRKTGAVTREEDGEIASFNEVMAIYDYLCRTDDPVPETGVWKAVHALSYAGVTSPSESGLSAKTAEYLQAHIPYIDAQLKRFSKSTFPIGDHAGVITIFDRMNAVFQFWEGDEEFPPSVRFLWDETAPTRLKFETLWYVMGDFERRLIAGIEQACAMGEPAKNAN